MSEKIKNFSDKISGKRVAVIGIGVSNKPLIHFLQRFGASVVAYDKKSKEELGEIYNELEKSGVDFVLGEGYLDNISEDIIFKTPGMRYDIEPLAKKRKEGAWITSEMEVFFDLCPAKIIAVTGSDGKTTTTTLIHRFLKESGIKTRLGGNIGRPLIDEVDEITPDEWMVLELSSFQLHTMKKSPDIAVVTNIKTGKAEYKTLATDNWDKHIKTIWASCALPILFRPENLDGGLYMDGGIADPIPFEQAFADGCDKVITVLTRERSYSKESDFSVKLAKHIYRKYPEFGKVLAERPKKYNQSRNRIFEMSDNGEMFVIAPTDTTGFSRTERDPEKLRAMYNDGYNTAKRLMPELKKYLEPSNT